ncbi:head GIN domain-containing protein [Sphingobium nicotianae]|uniref:DUF2807 domain-containing protein n=1 Tax=Sphingobium nicotianae TaxID=2782607 RepID=A0A9X1DEZ1_9SPHN|nr:head GIN domain-containing protein [Sphingobium nicotianae]MBT2188965.1 DUF2807 domain-containing protein [Sphingobium nicotianae]
MKDKTRLVITGAVAIAAVAATVGGHGFHINLGDDEARAETTRVLPNLRNFDGVTLVGPDDVIVTQGRDFSVKAEGDPDALDQLNIYVRDGALYVGRKDGGWTGHRDGHATIHVTLPALSHASLTGSGDLDIDKLAGKQAKAEITGPGNLSIAALTAETAELALTGSGNLTVGGKAATALLTTTGSGDIDADKLVADTAALKLIGSGDVQARATRSAAISIMGTGDAQVRGTASCTVTKMGTGEAECSTTG